MFIGVKHFPQLLTYPGIDTDARDQDGKTVLHLAADNSSLEILEALVDSGKFDIRARCPEFGFTALHFATCMEDDEPSAEKVGMSFDFEPILTYLKKALSFADCISHYQGV